jgi:predicted SnoaL-like aldol condensation-catalyzing enzyme
MNTSEFEPHQMPRAIVNQFYDEFLNEGNASIADQLFSPDYTGPGGKGPEDIKAFASLLHQGFPDLHFKIQDMVLEGARVAVRWEMEGTHRGPFAGVTPTGRRISHHGMAIYRIKDGKIVGVRADVAHFMIGEAGNPTHLKQIVGVAN